MTTGANIVTEIEVGAREVERLAAPRYSYAEADRIAGASRGTTKRWTRGYVAISRGQHTEYAAVTPRTDAVGSPGVSFFDLIEVAAIGRLKSLGWSLPSIRRIVENCQQVLEVRRPLVTERFKTDGREAFVSVGVVLVDVGVSRRQGQEAWDEMLGPFLETVEYESRLARRWWPLGTDRRVVVDPDFGFGYPVIEGSGVRTESVLEQVEAGSDPHQVAYDFALATADVDYALAFEATRSR
jgi:uncharacterized protein (DUF433 family)